MRTFPYRTTWCRGIPSRRMIPAYRYIFVEFKRFVGGSATRTYDWEGLPVAVLSVRTKFAISTAPRPPESAIVLA